jgi:hypothetical protein
LRSLVLASFALGGCGTDDAATSSGQGGGASATASTAGAGGASSASSSSSGGGAASGPMVDGCELYSAAHPLNRSVAALPVHPQSDTWRASIGADTPFHADFGSAQYGYYGIPHNTVPAAQPETPVDITLYPSESDLAPYHVPDGALVEGPSDSHLLILHPQPGGGCIAEEMWQFSADSGGFSASCAARFDLRDDAALRPNGWTSADAAGLSIVQLTLKYEETKACDIRHAIRFTVEESQSAHIYPARHHAGSADPSLPPMGARFRLRASYDTSAVFPQARCFLEALKSYGGVIADNGSDWYFQGEPTPGSPADIQPYDGWDDDAWVAAMDQVHGSDVEFVETDFETPGVPDALDTTEAP